MDPSKCLDLAATEFLEMEKNTMESNLGGSQEKAQASRPQCKKNPDREEEANDETGISIPKILEFFSGSSAFERGEIEMLCFILLADSTKKLWMTIDDTPTEIVVSLCARELFETFRANNFALRDFSSFCYKSFEIVCESSGQRKKFDSADNLKAGFQGVSSRSDNAIFILLLNGVAFYRLQYSPSREK